MFNTKTQTTMKNYVLTGGTDCDGYSSVAVTRFTTEELAEKFAQNCNEGSDGLGYGIADYNEALLYAEQNDLSMPDYAFGENMEIIDDEQN